MSLPRYAAYKSANVPTIAAVPEHWELMRLRQIGPLLKGVGASKEDETDHGVPCVRYGDLYTTHNTFIRKARSCVSGERAADYTPIRFGDVLFAASGEKLEEIGKSAVNLLTSPSVCGGDLVILRPAREVVPEFLGYACDSLPSTLQKASMGRGTTIKHIYPDELRTLVIAVPPLTEQRIISRFLHAECAKIDALVAEQRRLIELLKEKRQAVISHAVTKGVNPAAPMKPSGIEWLGEIPKHWTVVRIHRVAEMQSGHTPDRAVEAYWDGGIPWVSLNDTGYLKEYEYISETEYTISEEGIANSSARLLPARVVVFSRDATIGRCAITTRPMAVSQHFIAWVCGASIVPEFLLMRLRSMTQELERLTTGATLRTIGMPEVRTLVTTLPPVDEQHEIVRIVRDELSRIDSLMQSGERAIELLQQRRSALISAAVTGQIDVRGLVDTKAA